MHLEGSKTQRISIDLMSVAARGSGIRGRVPYAILLLRRWTTGKDKGVHTLIRSIKRTTLASLRLPQCSKRLFEQLDIAVCSPGPPLQLLYLFGQLSGFFP